MSEIECVTDNSERSQICFLLGDLSGVGLIKAQLDVVNEKADRFGFERMHLDEYDKTIRGVYKPLSHPGTDECAGIACNEKNREFKEELSKLSRLCRLSLDSNVATFSDGRKLVCHLVDQLTEPSLDDKENAYELFVDNIWLFIEHSDKILSDSRMSLTPIFSQSFSPFFSRPTLGAFVEWWKKCNDQPIERNRYPICYISGNPMTGSHACQSVAADGTPVKADLTVSFIGLLKSFGKINDRYRYLSKFCQAYSLKEVVKRLSRG